MKPTLLSYLTGVLTLLTSFVFVSCHKEKKTSADDMVMPVAVAVPIVDSVTIRASYPGNLVADREVSIIARVDGIVNEVLAPSGSKVKKGQVLYKIEDTKYRDAVQQAKASLATAQSAYDYYKSQYAAMQKALQADAVSEMEVLEARNNMESSMASIENAKAALQSAEIMLGYCTIRAPFDGQLGLATIDRDAYVNGEDSPFTINTLFNDDILHAYVSVDESLYLQILNNQAQHKFTFDSVPIKFNEPLPHEYFSAINYTAPSVDTSTGTVTMRFNFENKWGELKSGMFMNVLLPTEVVPQALLIKDASVGTDQLGKYVYLVNDSNQVVYQHIEVGELYHDTLRIVKSGMTPQSRYVTEALLKVKDGMKVKPIEK